MFKLKKNSKVNSSQLNNVPITTVIGSEIIFKGDIEGNQTIKIDGRVKGNVHVENGIIIGENSVIEGHLKSRNIIVYGQVLGNTYCQELILENSGSINGDIHTDTIEIKMGGKYNGNLKMNQAQQNLSLKNEE